MKKNWLIRTKQNQILGPISKDKLKEFIAKKTINSNDEVCSGNGHWFLLSEEDLSQKYIFGEEVQGFNPISEAENVLSGAATTATATATATEKINTLAEAAPEKKIIQRASESGQAQSNISQRIGDINIPKNEDLLYPDIDKNKGSSEPKEKNKKNIELVMAPDDIISKGEQEKQVLKETEGHSNTPFVTTEKSKSSKGHEEQTNDKLRLILIMSLLFLIISFLYFYYFKFLNKSIKTSSIFLENAAAQLREVPLVKKKV